MRNIRLAVLSKDDSLGMLLWYTGTVGTNYARLCTITCGHLILFLPHIETRVISNKGLAPSSVKFGVISVEGQVVSSI